VTQHFSQRAREVAEDLFEELDIDLMSAGLAGAQVQFHLDGTSQLLDRARAELWIKESVDSGHPDVRYHIESDGPSIVVVNLAAFEDPDSQFFE
jgi:hypothetical protein